MNHLKSFLTGARYSAVDSQIPSWTALYDIDDTATFSHDSYTRLRANRSPREANLVQRLSILDRQTSELLVDSGESQLTTSLASNNPSKGLITHGLGNDEEKAREWFESMAKDLKNSEGWVRTRVFKCIDNLKTGVSIAPGPEAQVVPKYFAVHGASKLGLSYATPLNLCFITKEFTTVEATSSPKISSTALLSDVRKWGLYKAYPGIAQGNLGTSS